MDQYATQFKTKESHEKNQLEASVPIISYEIHYTTNPEIFYNYLKGRAYFALFLWYKLRIQVSIIRAARPYKII